jgi:hypothetical protein
MNLPDAQIAHEGFFTTHVFTVSDLDKSEGLLCPNSWRKSDQAGQSLYIELGNTWIILDSGGGPIPGKPEVLLETPSDLNRVNSFLDLRVADIWVCRKQCGDKGAFFLTEPLQSRLKMALLHA